MEIDTTRYQTADGYPYRVLATDLPGEYPVMIFVEGPNDVAQLTERLICEANDGYSLVERQQRFTRYFNVYRAADGSFCLGKKSFVTDEERRATRDSQRAIAGLALTMENDRFTNLRQM